MLKLSNLCSIQRYISTNNLCIETRQGKKPRSNCPGKVNFTSGQVKMEVWFSSGQVKLVFLVIISNQNQEEQNNELKVWINLTPKHTINE